MLKGYNGNVSGVNIWNVLGIAVPEASVTNSTGVSDQPWAGFIVREERK